MWTFRTATADRLLLRSVLLPLLGARRLQPPVPSGMGVHWELRESMTEAEAERVMARGREAFPGVKPRVISDNGPQFISRDFKEYIRVTGMSHVRTSPPY